MFRREDRCHRFARALPDIPFCGQKSVAQDRAQDQLAHARHVEIFRIVDKNVPDQFRVIGNDRRYIEQRRLDVRHRVGRLAP